VRGVVEDRTAGRFRPIEASGLEPGLPRLIVGAQQRVACEIGGTLRHAARDSRAAYREERVVEQVLDPHAAPLPEPIADCDVGVVPLEIDVGHVGAHVEVDVRVRRHKTPDARQQPAGGKGRHDADAQQPRVGPHRDFLHGGDQLSERRAHARREALAFVSQADAATGALDEAHAEIGLERLDLVADRAMRHVQRVRGPGQAALARSRLERTQRLHRRKPGGHR